MPTARKTRSAATAVMPEPASASTCLGSRPISDASGATTAETQHAIVAATAVVGATNVEINPTPEMGSEDFAFMLQVKPGCYVWLGAGRGADTPNIHSPQYDFNDDVLPIGASYWVTLAEQQLSG